MDFSRVLKQRQLSMHMTNEKFSKFLGRSRTWLQSIYSKNPSVEQCRLSEQSMYDIHEKLDIPIDLMEAYNQQLIDMKKQHKDGQWVD